MEVIMEVKVGNSVIELICGNIVEQNTDAIVNAANNRLAPGGGVAGAIHRASGPELWEECKKLGGCATGEAKITKGYNLKAKYVIHTVGPVYKGIPEDEQLLRSAYLNSLELAVKNGIKSISFPAISTGVFGYPLKEAAKISLTTVIEYIKQHSELEKVTFVLFREKEYKVYEDTLNNIL
jgi:O-acetyl-ADP-ribose deacetylase (regulator of RNase III)